MAIRSRGRHNPSAEIDLGHAHDDLNAAQENNDSAFDPAQLAASAEMAHAKDAVTALIASG